VFGVILDLREDLISCLCLGVKSRALVLNAICWKLGCLELWWLGGIYSPNHQTSRWGGLLSMGAPDSLVHHRTLTGAPSDTVRCASHVTQLLGFWRFRLLELWLLGAPGRHYSLSGAPSGAALTLRELSVHCSRCRRPLESTVALLSRYFASTPDSSVVHRTVRWIIAERLSRNPKVKSSTCTDPGAPDTVRCARPGFSSISFAPLIWTLTLIFLLICVEPLAPVECII
jgi:hypothetical protein